MIGPKRQKQTQREKREAYDTATERDGGQCQRCGVYGPCDRDHRQNRDAFNTTPANLQLLGSAFGCGCHKWKTENPAAAYDAGFNVPLGYDPARFPAYRYGVGWVLYYDEPVDGAWWKEISKEEAMRLREYEPWMT